MKLELYSFQRNSLALLFSLGSNRVEEGRLAYFDFNIRTKKSEENRKRVKEEKKGGDD